MSCNGNSDIYSCVNKGIWVSPYNGYTGPTGATGSIGLTGPTGVMGPTGAIGPTGVMGPTGEIGPTGVMGPIGEIGPTGVMGPIGEIGPTGAIGPTGVIGPTGEIGPTGASFLLNLVDGNATGSVRQVGTPTGYTMGLNSSAFGSAMASGEYSFAEGSDTASSGFASHAEGFASIAEDIGSHAEGYFTMAQAIGAHSEGEFSIANGKYSHAEGWFGQANNECAHAEGHGTIASGHASHAGGLYTIASADFQTVIGKFNLEKTIEDGLFIIGNGANPTVRSNAFRVALDGNVYNSTGVYNSGADYAEMFEWQDGNPDNEDRVGYFVTLDGLQIRKATGNDKYILGVVSGTPSVVGDSYGNQWKDMYLKDEWGRIQYHWVNVEEKEIIIEEMKPVEKIVVKQKYLPKINPLYDSDKEYVPRDKRKEWAAIGMLGKLLVRDDGSCVVNGFCMPNENGVATSTSIGYRVLARTGLNQVLILFVIK